MPTLHELVRLHTELDDAAEQWLHLLCADWQIIADLAFADLVLWLPDADGSGFWAGAQMRPTTGPTAYVDDIVGSYVAAERRPLIEQAHRMGRIAREGDPEWRDAVPVRVEAIPVMRAGRVIAVVTRNTNLLGVRTPSRLELSYLQTAGELTQMIATGTFPTPGQRGDHADSPRVGDGFVRIDREGSVTYASPNALSLYRRLGVPGDLAGQSLAELTRELVPPRRRPDEETLSAVLGGRVARDTEIATDDVALILRAIPLRPQRGRVGALILVRDVTELRRRDRELVTKDATIREIHHRVKNNLQTVAAVLRLQARRVESASARSSLEEAVRRVGSIAVVHEILSEDADDQVGLDQVVDRLTTLMGDLAGVGGRVTIRRQGSFGVLGSEQATALAMVLTELIQNSLEHGFADLAIDGSGTVTIDAERVDTSLVFSVADDGRGLPEGFDLHDTSSLGLSIVGTLVQSELGGSMSATSTETGACVQVTIPVA